MSADVAIAAENVSHHFGSPPLRKQVLFDVSVSIGRGEIVIVTGPSGSGKTTFLTLVGALRSTQDGSLRVLGEELRGASEATLVRVRRRIGYIFQAHNLLDALTASQNVQMALQTAGAPARARPSARSGRSRPSGSRRGRGTTRTRCRADRSSASPSRARS